MGNTNIKNSISYSVDKNTSLTFKTRRNRKLNLTEYYDLVYEYKNDCLTAGIKYKILLSRQRFKTNRKFIIYFDFNSFNKLWNWADDLVN